VQRSAFSGQMAVDFYRQRLVGRLGARFDADQWQTRWAFGKLVDILRMAPFNACFAKHHEDERIRAHNAALLEEQNEQVRRALRRL
jgi:DNA topoisomerase IB